MGNHVVPKLADTEVSDELELMSCQGVVQEFGIVPYQTDLVVDDKEDCFIFVKSLEGEGCCADDISKDLSTDITDVP